MKTINNSEWIFVFVLKNKILFLFKNTVTKKQVVCFLFNWFFSILIVFQCFL